MIIVVLGSSSKENFLKKVEEGKVDNDFSKYRNDKDLKEEIDKEKQPQPNDMQFLDNMQNEFGEKENKPVVNALKEKINVDFLEAFKSKDMARKNFLGLLKGEIQTDEGRGTITTDKTVITILRKMEKSLKQTNNEQSLNELKYLESYLPKLMDEDQIRIIILNYKADGLTQMGQIMGKFNKEYYGLADNQLVSTIVAEV